MTLVTAGLLLICVLAIAAGRSRRRRPAFTLHRGLPGLRLAFKVEPLGMLFALIAAGLWIVNSLYSIGYMRGNAEARQTRFYVCFALALAATMGIAFAANVFTLFLFYEVLTLVTYPLVTHHGTDEARRGGRTYLGLLLGTSIVFLLPALVVHLVRRRHHRLRARRHPGRQARSRRPRRACSRSTCSASARPR